MFAALNEEVVRASVLYRHEESLAYRKMGIPSIVERMSLENPSATAQLKNVWKTVEAKILERARNLIPRDPEQRRQGYGPKVHEVNLEIAVGKECFLINLAAGRSPAESADYVARRLCLTMTPQDFFLRYAPVNKPDLSHLSERPEPA